MTRSNLDQFTAPDFFLWATGIEDTFITEPWPKTGRTLDEYELTGHYLRWPEDLELIQRLELRATRYGVPWHKIQPERDKWDWSFPDKTLGRLIELGIEPVVDLVHYGLPQWIEGAFLNPDFPKYMAEYAARVAERFHGRIHAFTPLNEPRITAWYCGKLGWWPPFRRGWGGFVDVMLGVCRGIVATVEALRDVDPNILCVHVDATDLYETSDEALDEEVFRRQEIVFLALDLVSGRVSEDHSLWEWLLKFGARIEDLEWFQRHAVELPLIGINLYPLFSRKILTRPKRGLRISMPYAEATIIDRLAQLYFERYGAPLIISETASLGSVKRRRAWLDSSVAAVKRVRERGIPLVGYTWWPLFALVTWAYRQGDKPAADYLKQMGLWDLSTDSIQNMRRVHTPLVEAYQSLVAGGSDAVGKLFQPDENEGRKHVSELLLRGV